MSSIKTILHNRCFINTVYVVCALFIFFIWMWTADSPNNSFNGDPRSKLSDIIDGSAHRPFVQRIMIPILTRTIHQVIPESWNQSISQWMLRQPKIQKEMQRLGWEVEHVPEYLIALTLACIFLIMFPFVMRLIVRTTYDTEEWIINLIPVLILFGLLQFFHIGTRYIYDFPALTLFSLGLYLMFVKKWLYYYGIFIIGLINKETMMFLCVPMAIIFYNNTPTRSYWKHIIGQVGLFIVIRGLISWFFRNSPGNNFEFHLFGNIRILADNCTPQQMIIWGIAIVLLAYQFNKKPVILRKALFTTVPFVIVTFVFACINELRDFYEVYPIVVILMMHTIFFSIFQFQVNADKSVKCSS
jgi:hypothetical protein